MPNNIIEIATNNKKLSVYHGFLRIEDGGEIKKDIPLNSIHALIVTAFNVVYTNNLLQRLCEENIPLVILGKNYSPSGMLLSYVGQSRQTEIQYCQIENKKPLEKKIWQLIVKEKIKNQSRVLDLFEKDNPLPAIYKTVLSGDSTNREAYAARLYFKSLFGSNFIRDKDKEGINSFLNYGYSILRSALARYVVAAGLNPSYGVGHCNKLNPFCLVDDLIEPFRPIVDGFVYDVFRQFPETDELTPVHKAGLSSLLIKDFYNGEGTSPLYMVLQQFVWDLVSVYKTKKVRFNFNPYLFENRLL
jgi:CRISP-associated protein Cas1